MGTKWGLPPFSHSDTNPVLGHFLVYGVDKTHVVVAIVGLIWLLLLNMVSFNFVQTPNKSLKPPCCCSDQSFTAFLLDVHYSMWPRSLFLQLFVPNDSAFASPTFVERNCCSYVGNFNVSKQTKSSEIVIHKYNFSANNNFRALFLSLVLLTALEHLELKTFRLL